MRLEIHPENPQSRYIQQAADILKKGGVIIIPTDSVYALACDVNSRKAYDRMCRIKGVKPEKALFSCLCPDLKFVGEYAIHIDTPTFKKMKKVLPGPYTFILEASKMVPRNFQTKRKTIGIRIPDHVICQDLMRVLGNPIMVSSLNNDQDDLLEYLSDPEEIYDQFSHQIDCLLDGGPGGLTPSTVVDCSDGEMVILREGLGEIDVLES